MGAHQKDIVEGFIHNEVCYGIPNSRKTSYIPATTSITVKRGQDILVGDWYVSTEFHPRAKTSMFSCISQDSVNNFCPAAFCGSRWRKITYL